MTREEAIKILRVILTEAVEFSNSVCYVTEEDREPLEMAIKALEQEPLEVEATKLQKAYNKGFEDCRQAVLEQIDYWAIGNREYLPTNAMNHLTERMQNLPPVTPQPKTGHWIWNVEKGYCKCSECGIGMGHTEFDYCPNCGARMVEPQETETWNGIHAQITAPKGTFERIFNDKDDDNDI